MTLQLVVVAFRCTHKALTCSAKAAFISFSLYMNRHTSSAISLSLALSRLTFLTSITSFFSSQGDIAAFGYCYFPLSLFTTYCLLTFHSRTLSSFISLSFAHAHLSLIHVCCVGSRLRRDGEKRHVGPYCLTRVSRQLQQQPHLPLGAGSPWGPQTARPLWESGPGWGWWQVSTGRYVSGVTCMYSVMSCLSV